MKQNLTKDKSYLFALRIIKLARWLKERRDYELASQMLRSGAAIGANVEEALAGVSRADFISKMSIASKEARETNYWLRLLRDAKLVPASRICSLIDESVEIVRILTAIVKSSQRA